MPEREVLLRVFRFFKAEKQLLELVEELQLRSSKPVRTIGVAALEIVRIIGWAVGRKMNGERGFSVRQQQDCFRSSVDFKQVG